MPACHVQRSITIEATPEQVFDIVVDFGKRARWSPSLGVDKNVAVTISDDPKALHSRYAWSSEIIGQGEYEHTTVERPTEIVDDVRVLQPYKSNSITRFTFRNDGDRTEITWSMRSKLPWFLFWMKSSMETLIGMDYQRGLKMLKELVETGEVLSCIDIVGIEAAEPKILIGHSNSTPIDGIAAAMQASVKIVVGKFAETGIPIHGEMITVYHPVHLKSGQFAFVTGYEVDQQIQVPEGLQRCELNAGKVLHIRHTGRYENLGNAWSAAYQYARAKKLKIAKQDGYEIYRNDPRETETADLITDLYVPLHQ